MRSLCEFSNSLLKLLKNISSSKNPSSKPTSSDNSDSISVETFGTGKISDEQIVALVRDHFELRPKGLVAMLDLKRPIYRKTAAYGHFGREDSDFTWENTDKAELLRAAL